MLRTLAPLEPELLSLCNDRATGLTNEDSGSDLLQGKTLWSYPERPNKMWGPPSFPLNSLGAKRPGCEADHSISCGADLSIVSLCVVVLNKPQGQKGNCKLYFYSQIQQYFIYLIGDKFRSLDHHQAILT
jgi:hypothetical protein